MAAVATREIMKNQHMKVNQSWVALSDEKTRISSESSNCECLPCLACWR